MAVPLAVLDGATGPYDDPKVWALPILVAATAVAWIAGARDGPLFSAPPTDRAGRVLWALALAWMAWLVVTTATSIGPALSALGNFGRGMGLVTTASAGLLFFLVQSQCATRQRLEALVDAALLGSAPVCLLGLGQAVGWDPFPGSWDPAVAELSVRSTFGQHILLGSYLVLVIPLAAARLGAEWRRAVDGSPRAAGPEPRGVLRLGGQAVTAAGPLGIPASLATGAAWIAGVVGLVWLASRWAPAWWLIAPWGVAGALAFAIVRRPPDGGRPGPLPVAILAALLAAQVAVLALSRARGPLLGLLFAAGVTGLVLALRRRAWKAMAAGGVATALLAAGLVLMNVPGSPLRPLARVPLLSRLGELSRAQPGTPIWFRLRIWEGILGGLRDQARGEPVLPGTSPRGRLIAGYGLETQLLAVNPLAQRSMGRMATTARQVRLVYIVDRAHNTLLDHVATTGVVGGALWLGLIAVLLVTGLSRIGRSASDAEVGLRAGCLGAALAHLAEGQVGIVTPMALALFWIAAAGLAAPAWSTSAVLPPSRLSGWRWRAALGAAALAGALVAWATTEWLLSSMAYARGVELGVSQRLPEAMAAFQESRERMPWLPLPSEAVAEAGLRLASAERDPVRRARFLLRAEQALADLRRRVVPGATAWSLAGQVAFAQVRAGDRAKLATSLEAFAAAARLAPNNAGLLSQWGWALLLAGDPAQARQVAERAIDLSPRRRNWLAWTVLSLAAQDLGDRAVSRRAARTARRQAPPEAERLVERLLSRVPGKGPAPRPGGRPPGPRRAR
jgi:tetratricopeptide (TPR) repeat protein